MKSEKKILVIDDIETNLILIRKILEISHPEYEILVAKSGKQGIEIAQSELPETILLDIYMPEIDGFETCRILKSTKKTNNIPILMISAGADNSIIRIEGLKAGADAIISKPLEKEELIALVNVMLRIKRAEDILRKQNNALEIYIQKQINEFQQTEERFLQVSSYALQFFWEINPEGLVTYISPVIETILDYSPEEIIDKMYFSPVASVRNTKLFSKLLKGSFELDKYFKDEQLIFRHRKGKKVWMSVCGFPLKDSQNELIGYRGVCQDITERVKAEHDLQKSIQKINEYQAKLKRMNTELSIAEEKERRKMAEYLHDGIGQNLSLVNLQLTSLLHSDLLPKTKKTIVDSVDLINQTIEGTRSLTYDLSPPIIHEFGLIPAIKWKLDQIESKYGIDTSIQNNLDSLDINTDTRILLYRIISELLTNIIKHAHADFIKLEFNREQNYLYISVIDNGEGFNSEETIKLTDQGGFGLFSIKERLGSIQGSMHFESNKSSGTKVILRIPI